jgi:hypothetical protein
VITTETAHRYPAYVREALEQLIERWPVGTHVRHVNGWIGEVVLDDPANPLTITGAEDAHCLLTRSGSGAVCVRWTCEGRPATAWFRPSVLSRPDSRTRIRRSGR